MSDSRRRDLRLDIKCSAQLNDGRGPLIVRTEDVSMRGMFLRMDSPPALRRLVELQIVLPSSDIALKAFGMTVHRVEPNNPWGKIAGIGIELYGLDRGARDMWESFVRRLARDSTFDLEAASSGITKTDVQTTRRLQGTTTVLKKRVANVADLHVLHARELLRGGLFVESDLNLPLGAAVVVEIRHPETAEAFLLDGVVHHRVSPIGFGIELRRVDASMRDEFLDFIRGGILIDESEVIVSSDESAA